MFGHWVIRSLGRWTSMFDTVHGTSQHFTFLEMTFLKLRRFQTDEKGGGEIYESGHATEVCGNDGTCDCRRGVAVRMGPNSWHRTRSAERASAGGDGIEGSGGQCRYACDKSGSFDRVTRRNLERPDGRQQTIHVRQNRTPRCRRRSRENREL